MAGTRMDAHGAFGNTVGHRQCGRDDLLGGSRLDHRPVDRRGRRGGTGGRASAAGISGDSEIEDGRIRVENCSRDSGDASFRRSGKHATIDDGLGRMESTIQGATSFQRMAAAGYFCEMRFRTSAAWPLALTSGQTSSILRVLPMRKELRTMPMKVRRMNCFFCQAPNFLMVLWPGSLSKGKLRFCFALNEARALTGSALMPRMATPRLSNSFFASRNSDASIVQPGVLALGKKNRRTRSPEKSLSASSLPSSDLRRKAGTLEPTLSIPFPLSKTRHPAGWGAACRAPTNSILANTSNVKSTLRLSAHKPRGEEAVFGGPHRIASE